MGKPKKPQLKFGAQNQWPELAVALIVKEALRGSDEHKLPQRFHFTNGSQLGVEGIIYSVDVRGNTTNNFFGVSVSKIEGCKKSRLVLSNYCSGICIMSCLVLSNYCSGIYIMCVASLNSMADRDRDKGDAT